MLLAAAMQNSSFLSANYGATVTEWCSHQNSGTKSGKTLHRLQ